MRAASRSESLGDADTPGMWGQTRLRVDAVFAMLGAPVCAERAAGHFAVDARATAAQFDPSVMQE
jgi:hypothetical protein